MVATPGPRGEMGEFEITHTFGWFPLQQYLIPFPGGRLQCLPIAWNSREKRWYHLYPDRPLAADDWLYWTNNGQNWNAMCAECHSTDLRKNYDPDDETYQTAWSEISVGCEACHGPGSDHVAWAQLPEMGRPDLANTALSVRTSGLTSAQQVQLCAPCHARRMSLDDNIHDHADFFDYGIPQLLSEGMYFPDGQILDEVYVYGSFIQSKMHARDVRCSDCHDVHSIKRIKDGNDLCLQCHRAPFTIPGITISIKRWGKPANPSVMPPGEVQFAVGSGAQCEGCHMPGRHYMGVDYRPDHSFRIPRPDLSLALGDTQCLQPLPCGQNRPVVGGCHGQVVWPEKATALWHHPGRRTESGSVRLGGAGQSGRRPALPGYRPGNRPLPGVVLSRCGSGGRNRTGPCRRVGPASPHGGQSIRPAGPNQRLALIGPLLYDPVRAVRIEAARSLVTAAQQGLDPSLPQPYEQALAEYIQAMQRTGDFAASRHNLGNLYADLGQTDRAIDHYRKAIAIDRLFYPAKVNLAMLYNTQGQKDPAEVLLREVVDEHPDLYEIKYSLGLLLAEKKAFDDAVIYLGDAAAGLPQRSRIQYNLALLLKQLKRNEQAETALNRALSVDPENPDYLYALAVLYIEWNRLDDALKVALQLRDAHPRLAMGRDLVNYIRSSKTKTQ
jgi:tetratricopeptide (TPR) repeat protein